MSAPTEALAALSVKDGKALPAPEKMKAGKKGTVRNVGTNSWRLTVKKGQPYYLHDIRIHAVFENNGVEALREVTKQTRLDFSEQDRKHIAMLAFRTIQNSGQLKGDFIYDRAALLISLQEIIKGGGELKFTLSPASAPAVFKIDSMTQAREVRITIKKAADTYQVTSDDVNSKNELARLAIKAVCDVGTSQHLFERVGDFVVYGNGNAYMLDLSRSFDVGCPDKFGGEGLTKGARFVEGQKPGSLDVAVTVDAKKSGFHKEWQYIYDKMADIGCLNDPDYASAMLSGITVLVYYKGCPKDHPMANRYKPFIIGSVSRRRVSDITFTKRDGTRTTLVSHVLQNYNTRIAHPEAFVIVDKHNSNAVYSPECIRVAPNLRVKSENAPPAMIEKMIKASATLPAVRQAETMDLARKLNCLASNAAQARRGITMETNPITVTGRQLPAVQLGTGNGNLAVNGAWRQGKIAQAPLARFASWVMVHLNNGHENEKLVDFAADSIVRHANSAGFPVKGENIKRLHYRMQPGEDQLDSIFAAEKAAGAVFIVMICNDKIKNHMLLKFLELKYDVSTEQITSRTAEKLPQQANTAMNVVLKIVEKLGGQTHYISRTTVDLPPWIVVKGTMIVGLQMKHPNAMTGKEREAATFPSVPVHIGWSINAVRGAAQRGQTEQQNEKESTHFSSDWSYALPKDYKDGTDYYLAYKEIVLRMLSSYKKYRETIPMRIIVVRGGVAEGDYSKIRSEEVPIWHAAFESLHATYKPSLIFLTANEMHADRFYQEKIPAGERAPRQNLPSGTVIDSGVTNPSLNQFFIQSHVPLQGTAKVPSYVFQYDGRQLNHKIPLDLDDLERMMHTLCFSHGVCNSPTALPTPLHIAKESMSRARELFNFWLKRNGTREWTLEDVKKHLTMNPETSSIHGLRVNA